jgi:hypothetical protein
MLHDRSLLSREQNAVGKSWVVGSNAVLRGEEALNACLYRCVDDSLMVNSGLWGEEHDDYILSSQASFERLGAVVRRDDIQAFENLAPEFSLVKTERWRGESFWARKWSWMTTPRLPLACELFSIMYEVRLGYQCVYIHQSVRRS